MRNECVNVMAPCLNDLNEMYEIWNTTKAISHHLTELTSSGCKSCFGACDFACERNVTCASSEKNVTH